MAVKHGRTQNQLLDSYRFLLTDAYGGF